MNTILVLIIIGLVIYINRKIIWQEWCLKTKRFTVYRVYLSNGKWLDLLACSDDDMARIHSDLNMHLRTGEPWNPGMFVTRFDIIRGPDHDGRWSGNYETLISK